MQIKIFLIGILIACSYLIGEFIYQAYTKRHKQLNELIRILGSKMSIKVAIAAGSKGDVEKGRLASNKVFNSIN